MPETWISHPDIDKIAPLFLWWSKGMPAAYSTDLRQKAISAYENGEGSQIEIAERFSIGRRTFQAWIALKSETGDVKPREHIHRGRKCVIGEKELKFIECCIEKKPDVLISDLIEATKKRFKKKASQSMISRAMQKLNFRRKKKSIYAQEQGRDDVKKNGKTGKKT